MSAATGATSIAPGTWTAYHKQTGAQGDEKVCIRCHARTSLPSLHGWWWQWAPDHQTTHAACPQCIETLRHRLTAKPLPAIHRRRGLVPPSLCENCNAPTATMRTLTIDKAIIVLLCSCGWDWYLLP